MREHRILVVEDDPDGQAVVAHVLDYMQYPHDVAETGEQALALLNAQPYAVVIIDLALPGMDGWDLLKAMQSSAVMATIPCVAITAYHSSTVREKAILSGFTAYFAKPLDTTTLMRELERLAAGG